MASTTMAFLTLGLLSTTLIGTVDANAFLRASAAMKEERMSEVDVQTSLLSEIENTFGEGSASSRIKQLEASLAPIYGALPKNEHGYLGHATVRYALHRLFVQRHGWVIKGLDAAGGHRNSTSGAGLLKEQVPAYIQDLFEQRLGGRGFGLHELGVLAATIEHLVHSETVKRMGEVLKLHDRLPTSVMSEAEADDILDTYMMFYILGDEVPVKNFDEVAAVKASMHKIYLAWEDTRTFVHGVRRNVTLSDASEAQKAAGQLDFSVVARAADRVGEQFGSFQDLECKQMKATLLKMEDPGTGRVRLSEFYKPALDGHWQFQESADYLRQLGALDESDPEKPRVIITNFITSPSNCIASSSFYAVCCMDECEGLFGQLEQQIAGPEASPAQITRIVSNMSTDTVAAPRELSSTLLDRLGEIAAEHDGSVPLHGRLFAQWMHHAFPRECPYPHLAGTTNPQSPEQWTKIHGEDPTASEEEMSAHVVKANNMGTEKDEENCLPWAPEEELLVSRQPQVQPVSGNALSYLRSVLLFAAMVSIVYGLTRNSLSGTTSAKCSARPGMEKFLV